MSDLFGNHIVGFPTRWLSYCEAASVSMTVKCAELKPTWERLFLGVSARLDSNQKLIVGTFLYFNICRKINKYMYTVYTKSLACL